MRVAGAASSACTTTPASLSRHRHLKPVPILAQLTGAEINNDLTGIPVPPLEVAWYNRGSSVTYARSDYAFGEINNSVINNEFDATIIEVAFHDDASDAQLMRDPKVRNWVARASSRPCSGS
jgi:hypothetical protein